MNASVQNDRRIAYATGDCVTTRPQPQIAAAETNHAVLTDAWRARRLSDTRTIATVLEAILLLAWYDVVSTLGYKRVDSFTRTRRVAAKQPHPDTTPAVCWAVDEACVWYFKQAYCLQRSSVATWMLRRRGIAARLVIGFRSLPLSSHAWVEVEGKVVNDRPQYKRVFIVLDTL